MKLRARDLMLWLSAVNRERLERCADAPGEHNRFVTAGGAVLATSFLAFVSGSFVLRDLVHVPLVFAIPGGACFALVIMNLERYVQASLRRQSHWSLTLLSAAPRLALSYFMGLVITIPLALAVFAPDIERQVPIDRGQALAFQRAKLNRDFADIDQRTRQRDALQKALSDNTQGAVLKANPEYRALSRRMTALEGWVRKRTYPSRQRAYERQINRLGPQIQALRSQLLSEESARTVTVRRQQSDQLDQVTKQLNARQAEKEHQWRDQVSKSSGPAGLAAKVSALDRVASGQPGVHTVKKAIVVFLVVLDCLPAILLTLSLVGRKFPYELLADQEEQEAAGIAKELANLHKQAAVEQATEEQAMRTAVWKSRLEKQLALQKEMDEQFIDELRLLLAPETGRLAREAANDYMRGLRRSDRNGDGRTAVPDRRAEQPAHIDRRSSLRDLIYLAVGRMRSRAQPTDPSSAES